MRPSVAFSLAFIAIGAASLAIANASSGPDATAFATSLKEFQALSPADQRLLVISAFEHRLEHGNNFSAEVKVRAGVYEYVDGNIGRQLTAANGRNYRVWRLGSTIRTDCVTGGPNVENPNQFISSSFDASKGINRSTAHNSDKSRCFGRVDVVPDPITESNRLAYWLDGKDVPMGEYLFRYLITHKDAISMTVSEQSGMIHLTVPWQPHFSDKPLGKREFTLDPRKGFMPVHGKGRWERDLADGKRDWRFEEFTVLESELVTDVWMPTRMREVIGGGPLGDKKMSVWDTTATELVHGKVSPRDVEVEFPPGAEIVDATQGIAYTVSPKMTPIKVEQLIGDRGIPVPRPRSWWPYVVGSFLAVIVLVLLWRIRSRHRMIRSSIDGRRSHCDWSVLGPYDCNSASYPSELPPAPGVYTP